MASGDSPFETMALIVISVFNTEFADLGLTMIPDNLHEALGRERRAAGIAPTEDQPMLSNRIVQGTYAEVRVFDLWRDEIDPETMVNPFKIAAEAERFRQALSRGHQDPGTGELWYFDVERTWYPNDPTGNKSRYHMTLRGWGNNSALLETVA
jgi:hypothetical protein